MNSKQADNHTTPVPIKTPYNDLLVGNPNRLSELQTLLDEHCSTDKATNKSDPDEPAPESEKAK